MKALQFGFVVALFCTATAIGEVKPVDQKAESKENSPDGPPKPMDLRFQRHMRYTAAGQEGERRGLWGPSDNFPRTLAKSDDFGESDKLSIVVSDDKSYHIGQLQAVRLRIVNRSRERVYFSAIDSHLYLVQEALTENKEWKPIERIPHGTGPRDCAVGFHRVSLMPGQYWELAGLRYAGRLKTKLRFRVDLGRNDGSFPKPGGKILYSNEYEGSVNPEQFDVNAWTGLDLNAR